MSQTNIIRILVLSNGAGAGKTSLIQRFLDDTFDHTYSETMGNIHSKKFTVDGEFVCLQILDTPGNPDLSNIAEESMKLADAFMIVYSMADPDALQASVALKFSIARNSPVANPPMILVGTKSDLAERKKRNKKRGKHESAAAMIARSWDCQHLETSAKQNINITDAFVELIREYTSQRRPVLHESRSSSLMSNIFPCLRAWTSSSNSYSRVIKSGWLHKRGFVVANWKRRYVVLYEDGSIQYFDRDDVQSGKTMPLGEFSLRDVWQIVEFGDEKEDRDGFVLQTADRDWYFGCVNETEKQEWLDVFVRMIAEFAARRGTVMAVDRTLDSTTLLDSSNRSSEEKERLSLMDQLSFSSTASTASSY